MVDTTKQEASHHSELWKDAQDHKISKRSFTGRAEESMACGGLTSILNFFGETLHEWEDDYENYKDRSYQGICKIQPDIEQLRAPHQRFQVGRSTSFSRRNGGANCTMPFKEL